MSTLFWGLEPTDPQEIDRLYEDLHVPNRPGDLLGGLVSLKNQVLQGRMDPDELLVALQDKDGWLTRVFTHLAADITPGGVPRVYQSAVAKAAVDVRRHLDNILVLLRAGLGEMSVFAQDGDPSHLDQGLILAAKGEHEIIELMQLLGDYQNHPMSLVARGSTFVTQLLAARMDGTISADGMARILSEYVAETRAYFDSAIRSLIEASALLQGASSADSEAVSSAMRRMRMAQMDAWRGMANMQQKTPRAEDHASAQVTPVTGGLRR